MNRTKHHIDAPHGAARPRLAQLVRATILGAAALAALPSAQAALIDFDNVGTGTIGHNEYVQQAGFYLVGYSVDPDAQNGDLVGAVVSGDASTCVALQCPAHDSHYYTALNDGVLEITRVQPQQTFSIKSFDASFLGATPGATYPAISGLLRVQGFFANGTSAYEDYALAGPGANGFEFAHFNASASFSGKQFISVDFFGFSCGADGNCIAFQSDKGQFAIDNITAGVSAVPEPSSWLMMGLGLLGVAARARRRAA